MSPEPAARVPSRRHQPLLWVAAAVAAGIIADRHCGAALGLYVWWFLAAALAVACQFLRRRRLARLSMLALLASFAALGGTWRHYWWNYLDAHHLARYAIEESEPVCVEAVAADRLEWTPAQPANPLGVVPPGSRSEITVEISRIRDGAEWLPVSGSCRLRVEGELAGIHRGDRLMIFGKFGRPLAALNPGQFDWAKFQRNGGQFVELFSPTPPCVSVIQQRNSAGGWMDGLVSWCEHQIGTYFGAEQQDLELALLIGNRTQLDDRVFEAFLRTGTVHLLVVSGLHVGFLAGLVWLLVRAGILTRHWGIFVSAILVLVYMLIVGGQSPVMRATVLVLLGLWMLAVGRRPSAANLLAAAALVVVAWNPNEIFRGGTQLSFLCVAVLSWYAKTTFEKRRLDPLIRLIHQTEPWPRKASRWSATWIGHMFAVSLVIFLATVPLVAYHFHIAAPVSVLLTPLIWPLVAVALVTGFAICTFAWLLPSLAYLLGWMGSSALAATTWLVEFADSFAPGHFYCPGPPVWWLLAFYAALALFALVPDRLSWKLQVATLALWIAAGLGVSSLNRHDDRLICSFLAVGHGTCVVLELPGGQTLLYDAGSLRSPEAACQTVASFLWSRGITRIDAVVLSHADLDHYNAIPGLIERFPIGIVYVSPLMFDPWATDGQLTGPNYLKETVERARVPLREVWMNDRLRTSAPDVVIDVLHPPRTGVPGRDNANSILLSVKYAGHTILLPGDLESPGIEAVMADPPLDCDILLAPHHGSAKSDPPGFGAWCRPEWVVLSGSDHAFESKSTSESYRAQGAQVLHTADLGAAQFSLGRDWFEFSTFRSGPINE